MYAPGNATKTTSAKYVLGVVQLNVTSQNCANVASFVFYIIYIYITKLNVISV
jgi:hypothetical protein